MSMKTRSYPWNRAPHFRRDTGLPIDFTPGSHSSDYCSSLVPCLYGNIDLISWFGAAPLCARMSTVRLSFRSLSRLRARPARQSIQISQYRRGYADLPKPPNPNRPGNNPPKGVWAPKTRLAFGIVVIGALIYSMVFLTYSSYLLNADHMHRLQKNPPSLTHLQ